MCHKHYSFKVTSVSTATVLQQEAYIAFYELPRGGGTKQVILLDIHTTYYLEPIPTTRVPLSLPTCIPILGKTWLTDQVRSPGY